MSKFTFICQEESIPFVNSVDSKRTVEFSAEALNDIMQEFENFLRGCGFYFNGRVDVVEEDWPEMPEVTFNGWESTVNSLMNPPEFRAAGLTGKNS